MSVLTEVFSRGDPAAFDADHFAERSIRTSSENGRKSSIAASAAGLSNPEGPGALQSRRKVSKISKKLTPFKGKKNYKELTMRLKVSPRTAKFLKRSNAAQAGERSTTSPGCAISRAVRTAVSNSSLPIRAPPRIRRALDRINESAAVSG